MDDEKLRFPSGRSVGNCRKDAKHLARELSISLSSAQDRVAAANGGTGTWSQSLIGLRLLPLPPLVIPCGPAITLQDMKAVLKAHPITDYGYGPNVDDVKKAGSYATALKEGQAHLLGHLDECNKAVQFLQHLDKRKTINRKIGTSYGLKHQASRFLSELIDAPVNPYMSNGAFICAAIHMGFEVDVYWDSPNPTFNISSRSSVFEWERLKSNMRGVMGTTKQAMTRLGELEGQLGVRPAARPWYLRQR